MGQARIGCGTLCAHVGYETHFYYEIADTNHEGPFVQNEPDNHHELAFGPGPKPSTMRSSDLCKTTPNHHPLQRTR